MHARTAPFTHRQPRAYEGTGAPVVILPGADGGAANSCRRARTTNAYAYAYARTSAPKWGPSLPKVAHGNRATMVRP